MRDRSRIRASESERRITPYRHADDFHRCKVARQLEATEGPEQAHRARSLFYLPPLLRMPYRPTPHHPTSRTLVAASRSIERRRRTHRNEERSFTVPNQHHITFSSFSLRISQCAIYVHSFTSKVSKRIEFHGEKGKF